MAFGAALSLGLRERMSMANIRFLSERQGDGNALRRGRIDLDIGPIHSRPSQKIQLALPTEQKLVGVVRPGHPLLKGHLSPQRYAAQWYVGAALRPDESPPVDETPARALSVLSR